MSKKDKVYERVSQEEVAKALGAKLIIDPKDEKEYGHRPQYKFLSVIGTDTQPRLWANPDLYPDLVKAFKEVFPDGVVLDTSATEPAMHLDDKYVFGGAEIREMISKYLNKNA